MNFLDLIRQRRSHYQLSDQLPVSQKKLEELLTECLEQTPSAFNSQSSRLILLTGLAHRSLWKLTQDILRSRVPAAGWEKTRQKIDSFAAAYGTVLYWVDQETVQTLQEQFPLYKEQFPIWAEQANGMLQFAVWTAFTEAQIGASLQHYNPLIDVKTAALFGVPSTWKLTAQMPFGMPLDQAPAKTYMPLSERFIVRQKPVNSFVCKEN